MTPSQERVAHFIRLIRGLSSQWLRYACTRGGCHRFFLILQDRFPGAKPYYTRTPAHGHVVTRINGKYWDIWGEHDLKIDGRVKPLKGELLKQMASCYFDEAFAIMNSHLVREEDIRKPKGVSDGQA